MHRMWLTADGSSDQSHLPSVGVLGEPRPLHQEAQPLQLYQLHDLWHDHLLELRDGPRVALPLLSRRALLLPQVRDLRVRQQLEALLELGQLCRLLRQRSCYLLPNHAEHLSKNVSKKFSNL